MMDWARRRKARRATPPEIVDLHTLCGGLRDMDRETATELRGHIRQLEDANQQLRQENNALKASAKASEHSETIAELERRVGSLEEEKPPRTAGR